MTTLVDIPSCTAVHLPTPTSSPLPLAFGDLTLTIIPANPPTHPSQTVTLTIGASSFPLLPNSPVQKIGSIKEHASYVFSPVPADGGAGIGQVKISMKDSKSQGEWEATDALCTKFEQALKANGVWSEKTLFVDDEYETGGVARKGWGETVAGAVMGAGQAIAGRLNAYTDNHVATTNPTHPPPPSAAVASNAASVNNTTDRAANMADAAAIRIGEKIVEAGQTVGEQLPDSIAKPAQPVKEEDKSDLRKMAESGWEQVSIAAKGVASAGVTVGGALSESAHRAVEHNFGKEAEAVAQDVGQSGANIGSAALSAAKTTSVIAQGGNVASGVAQSKGL